MDRVPSEMSDEELVEFCVRNNREQWLTDSGCLVGMSLGICLWVSLALFLAFHFPWPIAIFASIVAFLIVPAAVFFVEVKFAQWAGSRARPYQRELMNRYGPESILRLRIKLAESLGHQDHLILYSGCLLPHGPELIGYLFISASNESAGEVWIGKRNFDFGKGNHPRVGFERKRTVVSKEETQSLAEHIERLDSNPKTTLASEVVDGFPVLVEFRTGPSKVRSITCNLVGIPERDNGTLIVELAKRVFRLCMEPTSIPLNCASTDKHGPHCALRRHPSRNRRTIWRSLI